MYARITTVHAPPDRMDEGIRIFESEVLPPTREQPGFRGAYLLVDRATGKAISITLWETEADLERSDAVAHLTRVTSTLAIGASAAPLGEHYELAIEVHV